MIEWLKRLFKRKRIEEPILSKEEKFKESSSFINLTRESTISVTKLSKAIATAKNIERKQNMPRKISGKFKPRTAHEKRLWKLDKKPKDVEGD